MTLDEQAKVLREVSTVCVLGCEGQCVCCRVRRAIGFESMEDVFKFCADHPELVEKYNARPSRTTPAS